MRITCPSCGIHFHGSVVHIPVAQEPDRQTLVVNSTGCTSCGQNILYLSRDHRSLPLAQQANQAGHQLFRFWPRVATRAKIDATVPREIADDYNEACLVLDLSPKASAALSRRCLQHLLLRAAGVTKKNLADQIQEVLDSQKLPSHLAEQIDAIRNIGNFAAHPLKDHNTGAVVDVEDGEAEWNLDVLERLFDFYYTQPAKSAAQKAALNQKLAAMKKPPVK